MWLVGKARKTDTTRRFVDSIQSNQSKTESLVDLIVSNRWNSIMFLGRLDGTDEMAHLDQRIGFISVGIIPRHAEG